MRRVRIVELLLRLKVVLIRVSVRRAVAVRWNKSIKINIMINNIDMSMMSESNSSAMMPMSS